jgi:hypothetical protein
VSSELDIKTIKVDIMNEQKPPQRGYDSRILASTMRLFCWGITWVGATALMGLGPKFLWHKAVVFTLLAVGLEVAVGVGWMLATKKYVMELDELQRRVWLNALGITVGVAVIAVPPLSVMDVSHVLPFPVNISHLVLLMGLTFVVSFVRGMLRYR